MPFLLSVLLTLAAAAAAAAPSPVSFHLMQIEYAVGGVNGDTTAQAIQLRMRADDQNHVSGARLVAYDAAGQNPVVLVDFDADVPNGEKGKLVLITSANLIGLTDPPSKPDFVLTNTIPADYLAAGRLTYESDDGSEIIWSLAAGGDAYTGPHDGSILNDDDGNFGPAFAGPFPTGVRGLHFNTNKSQSHSNATDYTAIKIVILRNNAGESFTLFNDPCYADCDGDLDLNIFDFFCFIGSFNEGGPGYADCNSDQELDLFDFFCYVNEFGLGC